MCVTDVLEVHLRNCIIKMCRQKLPAAMPPCNQSHICFRIIKCLRAIISSASSCISFKTSYSHGERKSENICQLQFSLYEDPLFSQHLLALSLRFVSDIFSFFLSFMNYVLWYIVYEQTQ